ncbi:MAG TPA: glycosyltransferase, partial [Vicinamibacterales bacterium]|nr:glycosyltransferase [Vicinamibacterales bacterium]
RAIAGVCREYPQARLVRVGGPFTPAQERLIGELGLANRISVLPSLDDRTLAAVYRRSALVLLPSEREGFGLPVVEAMACGTPVVASDIPVLREVGGGVAEHCPVGDVDAWVRTSDRLLRERATNGTAAGERRDRAVRWASHFTWERFAATLAGIYVDLAGTGASAVPAPESAACPA